MADRTSSLPGPVRRLLRWAPIERLVATVNRSAVLRGRPAFVVRELLGRHTVADYRLVERTVIGAFASISDGRVGFLPGRYSLSREAREGEPDAVEVRAADALPHLAEADLAKVDIEGAEWPIIGDPRLANGGPRAVVLEYHPE